MILCREVGTTLRREGKLAQDEWPLLVVVPASLRLAWAEELARWLPHLRPSAVHVIEGRTDRLDGSTAPRVRPPIVILV